MYSITPIAGSQTIDPPDIVHSRALDVEEKADERGGEACPGGGYNQQLSSAETVHDGGASRGTDDLHDTHNHGHVFAFELVAGRVEGHLCIGDYGHAAAALLDEHETQDHCQRSVKNK